MTNIDISFNAGFIPQVTINFVDVRGATLFEQGSCSPYGAFFHQPWPIFELTVKGYYGNPVKYSLSLKNFTTKFNPSNGNYESTAEFIGYSYAFLSDILIGYALAAPYMEGSEDKLKNIYKRYLDYYESRKFNQGKNSFNPINSETGKPLTLKNYLDAVQKLQSGQDGQDPAVIDQIRSSQELRTLTDSEKLQSYLDEIVIELDNFSKEWIQKGGTEDTINGTSKLKATNYTDDLKIVYEGNVETISNSLQSYNNLINENNLGVDLNLETQKLPSNNIINNSFGVEIDLKPLKVDIDVKKGVFEKKISDLRQGYTNAVNELIKKELGFVPTIRSFFTVLLANTELFLELLKDASADAEKYHSEDSVGSKEVIINNVSTLPIKDIYYAWPTYVSNNIEEYPGRNRPFRNWPELIFTENFIKALKQMIKDIENPNAQENFLEYEGKPGYDNYLPINAMESPAGEPTCNIAYFNNTTPEEVYKNIGERFIVYNSISSINNRYLYSSAILKSYRKYKELDDTGFYPATFTNLDNLVNKNYLFSGQYPKNNWGKVEAYNFFYNIENKTMFNVIKSASKEGVGSITDKVLKSLGLENDGSEYYFYDKDILLNPKEGVKTIKPDIHEIDGDSLVTFLPCENCTGAIEQGTSGAIVDFNEVLRNPVTNSRALLLKNANLIVNNDGETKTLIEELTKNTGFNPITGLNDQEGITRIVDLSKEPSTEAFKESLDSKWWRYNGLRLKKSTPWMTHSSSIGDLSVTSKQQYAKISNFSQVNNVILDTMVSAEIYPDYTFNYTYFKGYKTKEQSNYGDFSYAYNNDIGELTHNIGNSENTYRTGNISTELNSGWYTIVPSYSAYAYGGDTTAYNYNKNICYIGTYGKNYPEDEWRLKQVYYSPAATDTIYGKKEITQYFNSSKTTSNDFNNKLQQGKYNKNWVNQTNLIIDTPFWKHNFPSQESSSDSTNSYSYSMFGSSVLAEVQSTSTGNKIELSKDGFNMGVKLDLEKGLGTYIGYGPALPRSGNKPTAGNSPYSQIDQDDSINMLTTHNKDVFNIYAIDNKVSKSQVTNPSNLNRTQAWKGSLAYLFLANQLHRPWTGMYTNSNKYLGPQGVLGSGSLSAIIPKHSVYLMGAVLWRMRESGLLMSDDPKWNIEPQQSFINGKYIDPLNVPLLPEEITFIGDTKNWSFNTKVMATIDSSTPTIPPVTLNNGPYNFKSVNDNTYDINFTEIKLIKYGSTIKMTDPTVDLPSDEKVTFTYKCNSGSNKFNFYWKNFGSTYNNTNFTPPSSVLTYVKNTMCKKSKESDFNKEIKSDIENDTYNSNWGVRPPMASLLINSNTYDRKSDKLGVICFPRADEWPAANLGMTYALDLEDEVYEDSGDIVNPFKNQYKIFTPIFNRKAGLALRMSNNLARFIPSNTTEQTYLNNIKKVAKREADRIGGDADIIAEKLLGNPLSEGVSSDIITINQILKDSKNLSSKDESFTKLSFIYHDIPNLKTSISNDPINENGRSIRGYFYPESISNEIQLKKAKDKEKDKQYSLYKLKNTNLSQNLSASTLNVLPEIKYNNEVLNTVEKSNTVNEETTKKEKLYKEEARGYLRGYIPIGPEIWFMPTSVKEKFISLFEDFVGDFNNFEDSSDFDFILKTIDPLNFPRPELTRDTTPNEGLSGNKIKLGLPDDLLYSNFVSIEGGSTLAPFVLVDNLQVDNTIASSGTTYYTKYKWEIGSSEGKTIIPKNTKFTKNGNNVEFQTSFLVCKDSLFGCTSEELIDAAQNIKGYFSCTDRVFRQTSNPSVQWNSTNPQKPLETELGKKFCGDPAKVIEGITPTFTNSEPHPSVKKWLQTYDTDYKTKNIATSRLGENGDVQFNVSMYNKLRVDNTDVQQIHKILFQDGYVLSSLSPRIWWGEIKIDDDKGSRI